MPSDRTSAVPLDKPKKGKKKGCLVKVAQIFTILASIGILLTIWSLIAANQVSKVIVQPANREEVHQTSGFQPIQFNRFDAQKTLNGWYFEAPEHIGSVIWIGGREENRLPLGKRSAQVINKMTEAGYGVLLFDSNTNHTAAHTQNYFGYQEWQDVLGAIEYLYNRNHETNIILYGINEGCASALLAYHALPNPKDSWQNSRFAFDQNIVQAMILDGALPQSDDYILQQLNISRPIDHWFLKYTVPTIIRALSTYANNENLAEIAANYSHPIQLFIPQAQDPHKKDALKQFQKVREAQNARLTQIYDPKDNTLDESQVFESQLEQLDIFFKRLPKRLHQESRSH